jgi:hypothetical protein
MCSYNDAGWSLASKSLKSLLAFKTSKKLIAG